MWTIAYYEMISQLRLRPVQIMLFFMPIVIIFILGSSLSVLLDSNTAKVPIVKLAYSQEGAPGAVYQRLQSGPVSNRLTAAQHSSKEAVIEAVKKGKADIGLILTGSTQSQLVLGRSMENNMSGQLQIDALLSDPGADNTDRLDAVKVENPVSSYGQLTALQYFSVTMLVMYSLYTGMSAAIVLVENRRNGTHERLFAQPIRPGKIMAGLLLGSGLVAGIQTVSIIVGTAVLLGVSWGHQPFILAFICLLLIACCMGLGAIAARFVRSRRTIQMLFNWLIIAMTLVSGGYNPQLTDVFGRLQLFTVNHWAVNSMLNLMRNGSMQQLMHSLAPLAAVSAAVAAIVWMSYRGVGSHE